MSTQTQVSHAMAWRVEWRQLQHSAAPFRRRRLLCFPPLRSAHGRPRCFLWPTTMRMHEQPHRIASSMQCHCVAMGDARVVSRGVGEGTVVSKGTVVRKEQWGAL